ncbi:uncharacterized protein [Triticum aestivum]|uniref:uncharacterized protein n=1 Tax=Triticum aestivum TaxID=4565 RepID=UPI001D028335|nr:uncharacterized protein LOC123134358 [Triticum aestivum]
MCPRIAAEPPRRPRRYSAAGGDKEATSPPPGIFIPSLSVAHACSISLWPRPLLQIRPHPSTIDAMAPSTRQPAAPLRLSVSRNFTRLFFINDEDQTDPGDATTRGSSRFPRLHHRRSSTTTSPPLLQSFHRAYVCLPDVGAQEPDATVDDDSYYTGGAYYYVQAGDDDHE